MALVEHQRGIHGIHVVNNNNTYGYCQPGPILNLMGRPCVVLQDDSEDVDKIKKIVLSHITQHEPVKKCMRRRIKTNSSHNAL
jgi:hypothetical protein